MEFISVLDAAFRPYGRVVKGFDTQSLLHALREETPLPAGVCYVASEPALEQLPIAAQLRDNAYGGMPVQLGYCNGHNTSLNCLEYHRSSEFNLGTEDFVLLLAHQDEIENGALNTTRIKAFFCPKDTLVELYATTLHYAPCEAKKGAGFRVLVALPKGTNADRPTILPLDEEDARLWACNKWLLAHCDTDEAAQGAHVGLTGENIDIQNELI